MFASFISNYKNVIVYLILVMVCIILMNWRTNDIEQNLTSALETILSPIIWVGESLEQLFAPMISEAGDLEKAKLIISELETKISEMEEKQVLFEGKIKELEALQGLIDDRSRIAYLDENHEELIPARVVSKSPIYDFQVLVIDRGAYDKVRVNMPVVAIAEEEQGRSRTGVVGKIGRVGFFYSVIIPITSQFSNISAKIYGKRYSGILQGLGRRVKFSDRQAILNFLDRDANVELGDEVVTSGATDPTLENSFFLPYLPLGTISEIPVKDQSSFSQRAYLKPFVNFSTLENVYVINSETKDRYFSTSTFLDQMFQLLQSFKKEEEPEDFWEENSDLLIETP
jgi:rod shape-determining protein MreC